MLANYYKTAIRHIGRNRFFTGLNVIGLSIGIAFFLLIGAFGWSEWHVNRDLRHADRQYFLRSTWKDPNMGLTFTTAGQLALALRQNYPTLVANYFRWDGIDCNISVGDRLFRDGVAVVDSTMLDMYGFRLLQGDPHTALRNPFTIVITANKAMKYFGRTDVVGRDLTVANFAGGKQDFRITAVMADPPRNSVTRLLERADNSVFIPDVNLSFFNRNMDWPNFSIPSYVELQPGVRPEQLAEPISHLIKVNFPKVAGLLRVDPIPLTEYYLSGARVMVMTLFYIAGFILLMAVINFVNLAIGRSASRMKEIGVRKVLGGLRRQLIGQFLAESVLLSLLATACALLLYGACARLFSGMLGKVMPTLAELPTAIWIVLPLFAVALGCLAGTYPAFVLSSQSGVDALKGRSGGVREHTLLRKGLVGFQFCIAIIALAGVVIVTQQVRLFFSDRLGYNKEYVVSARLPRDWTLKGVQHIEAIRNGFAALPGVDKASISYEIPNGNNGGGGPMYREGGDSTRAIQTQGLVADEYYSSVYQIPMAAGDFYSKSGLYDDNDSLRVVVNETAAHGLGWKQAATAIGQRVRMIGRPQTFTIAGVVKDFHFDVMGAPIQPEMFSHPAVAPFYRFISFRLRPGNMATTLAGLQQQWRKLVPGAPFEYQFMDETLSSIYTVELRLQKAADTATALSLGIVVMGVIGLLSLSVEKRRREIAIRKVVGASVAGIIRLFLQEYVPLLLGAALVAIPAAWWLLQRWLDNYNTRISITVIPFVAVIVALGFLMAMLIVAQTATAASASPTNALRSE